jgi:MoaA/NifB/PqqE/SkfB family radical SAM enzyme
MPEFAEFGKVVQNTTFNRIVNPDIDEIDDIFKDAGVHKMYVEPFIKNQTNQEDD